MMKAAAVVTDVVSIVPKEVRKACLSRSSAGSEGSAPINAPVRMRTSSAPAHAGDARGRGGAHGAGGAARTAGTLSRAAHRCRGARRWR
eukprot:scaffold48753_cov29-Tisochrysis_lutea.AAC.1